MATGLNLETEVRRIIHDEVEAEYRWSDAELVDYINAGQRTIVTLVPEANVIESIVDLGATRVARQTIPTGGIKFVKAARNYADDGTTPQGTIRFVEKDALDTFEVDWEYVSAKADGDNYFEHYCHDGDEPRVFYLYPAPAADNKFVAIVYSDNPDEITALSDTLSLGDEYYEALVMYVIYRCLSKESQYSLPSAFRDQLWGNFLQALGLKRQSDSEVDPSLQRPPEDN